MKAKNFLAATIAVIILCCSCQNDNCDSPTNEVVVKQLENCLLITMAIHSGQSISFENRWKSIECLEAVTGIESNIEKDGDSPYIFYKAKNDDEAFYEYAKDVELWSGWLRKNYGSVNERQVENALKRHSSLIGSTLTWPESYFARSNSNEY